MEHTVIYKKEGFYAAFPVLTSLPDGRLAVGIPVSPFHDHYAIGDWIVLVSKDEGQNWQETKDTTIPHTWPGTSPREKYDRLATVLPDGSYLCVGSVGWEVWKAAQKDEAESRSLVHAHPADPELIIVGGNKLFVQRSADGGKTWSRREWEVPGVHHITAFPRHAVLADGTLLVTLYGSTPEARRCNYVLRSTDHGETWRFLSMGAPADAEGSETALLEVSPGCVLAHTRILERGTLLERWSDDGGKTWSHPLNTTICGYPPHLILLNDNRMLCSYGYRHDPMGIRAVLSEDGGNTWGDPIVLRDDGGTPSSLRPDAPTGGSDVGYPISTQLSDGSILSAYYITLEDGITHSATTRWQP